MKSPLLDFSIESFEFAVELFMNQNKTKFSLLHLDNSLELLFKASLLNNDVSIFEENKKKTLNFYSLMKKLDIQNNAYINLLHEERNRLQHSGGTIESKHVEYFLKIIFEFFELFLKDKFDLDLKTEISKSRYSLLEDISKDIPKNIAESDNDNHSCQLNPNSNKYEKIIEESKNIGLNYLPISIIASGVQDGKPYCDQPIFKIKQNERLAWINDSHVAHTITSGYIHDNNVEIFDSFDGGFDSGLLLYGDSFNHKFTEKYEYNYLCKIHPWEQAKIIVE